ncbi:alpha/beta hydrolase [Streptomyces sp. NPDC059010]|uniref:alpha/beta hydrolase n=1 Tax=Streptomyces sp. NPDC059010 TaxID=3346695 RepID=UPI0036BB1CBD
MATVDTDQPAILLVHGAWHGAWCWEMLIPELTALGWRVATVDLPSASSDPENTAGMYDDARVIRDSLNAIGGQVTVLAHSYGGIPATEAVADVPHVSQFIYLSAFQVDEGVSLSIQSGGQMPGGETGTLPAPEDPRSFFYADAAPEDAERAAARLVLQSVKSFGEPVTTAGWKTVPSSYIICEQDMAMPVAFQESMAIRSERVYRLSSSHSPFLSMPAELAGIITSDAGRQLS